MNVTIAICTWNRAHLLDGALQSLTPALAGTGEPVEVLVVDNNSSDGTRHLVERWAHRLPLRYLFEAAPGLSNARNAAVHAARGRYIAWIDDDVRVAPGWLAAYLRAVDEFPEAAFFGGPIEPVLQGSPPAWLTRALPGVADIYSARNLGDSARPISVARDLPYGANYMVRTREQHAIRYDPALGRQPRDYWLAGEEVAVLRAMLEAGHTGRWIPAARISHLIPPDRQSLRYLISHGLGSGRTLGREHERRHTGPYLGWPAWMWRHYLRTLGRGLRSFLLDKPETWAPALYSASVATGLMFGGGCGHRRGQ